MNEKTKQQIAACVAQNAVEDIEFLSVVEAAEDYFEIECPQDSELREVHDMTIRATVIV